MTLRTFKECNLQAVSPIPSKINVTYTTNIQSLSDMENQLSETQLIQDEQDMMILENTINIAMIQLTM